MGSPDTMSSAIDDLTAHELQVRGLYTHDVDGRIRLVNEPGGGIAPRFYFARTSSGNLWRVRHDLPDAMVRALERLAGQERVSDDLDAPPDNMAAFIAVLQDGEFAPLVKRGPAYRFPATLPRHDEPIRITRSNSDLLREMPAYRRDIDEAFEEREPRFAIVEDGIAVSICNTVRLTDRSAEAGVDTLEGYRGRGYAPQVVAAWAHAVRAAGRIPFYSTSRDNFASQSVARKLGLIHYASYVSIV
ncbi:MAG TPA: GNAT family N-acetyltransferase [Thermomicrobiales bacterium]|nr:GNAT family N-acetyltransferase [Thermomicrobiales bacterium]